MTRVTAASVRVIGAILGLLSLDFGLASAATGSFAEAAVAVSWEIEEVLEGAKGGSVIVEEEEEEDGLLTKWTELLSLFLNDGTETWWSCFPC